MEIIYALLGGVILMLGIIAYRLTPTNTTRDMALHSSSSEEPKEQKESLTCDETQRDVERWRSIFVDGINTGYQVSSKGNFMKPNGKPVSTKTIEELTGERRIAIKYARGVKQVYASRLVATAFIENPHDYYYVKHIDKNPLNNNVENLMWVYSKRENK